MPKEQIIMLKAITDESRLRIIKLLEQGERCACVLLVNIPQQVYRLSEKAVPPFRGKCTAYPPRCTAHSLGYDVKII